MFFLKKIILLMIFISVSYSNTIKEKPTLLFYCGVTMIEPMKKIAKIIEDKHNCKVIILQGASKDLSDSILYSKKGDLFLAGTSDYIQEFIKKNHVTYHKNIGYNLASIFVQKGNPLKITSLKDFVNKKYKSILCNPEAGSIGRMTKKIFTRYKNESFFEKVLFNSTEITIDSKGINKALINKSADISINWYASSFREENKKYIDVIKIDEKYAPKKDLILGLLTFSKNKKIAKAFIDYSISKEGQKIIKSYGF